MTQAEDFKNNQYSFLMNDGIEIFFERTIPLPNSSSSNLPIFLVNGHTRSSSDFRVLAKKLAKAGFETVAVDNRNSGRSICNQDYGFESFTTDLIQIMDKLELKKTHFLGISMGGAIVQNLAARFCDRISKAIIVSSFVENQNSKPSIPWGDSLESVKFKLSKYFAAEYSKRNHLLLEAMSKQILDKIKHGDFTENASRQRQALKGLDLSKEIVNIKSSCLIIHGDEDQIISIEQSQKMSQLIPNSSLKIYEGVGHLILAERPEPFLRDVLKFLS